jgi:hypothetical protein
MMDKKKQGEICFALQEKSNQQSMDFVIPLQI